MECTVSAGRLCLGTPQLVKTQGTGAGVMLALDARIQLAEALPPKRWTKAALW
ncbi:MAG: hypothetical protein ACLRPX_10905 [Ruthenibacterium sp.]